MLDLTVLLSGKEKIRLIQSFFYSFLSTWRQEAKALQVTQSAQCVVFHFLQQRVSALALYKTSKSFKGAAFDSKNVCCLTTVTHELYSSKWSQTSVCFCRHALASHKHHAAILLWHLKVFLAPVVPRPPWVTAKFVSGNSPAVSVGPRKILSLHAVRFVHLAACTRTLIKPGTAAGENQWISTPPPHTTKQSTEQQVWEAGRKNPNPSFSVMLL